MWQRLTIIALTTCVVLLGALYFAWPYLTKTTHTNADVKSVDLKEKTITLASGKGCGSILPSTVQFSGDTQIFGPNNQKIASSTLGGATRICFECAEESFVTKILIEGISEDVKSVNFQTGKITIGEGSDPTSQLTFQFDSNTQFADANGHNVDPSRLETGASISLDWPEKGPVKKITIKSASGNVKSVNFQTGTITLGGDDGGCGSTTPPTVKFDENTQFVIIASKVPDSSNTPGGVARSGSTTPPAVQVDDKAQSDHKPVAAAGPAAAAPTAAGQAVAGQAPAAPAAAAPTSGGATPATADAKYNSSNLVRATKIAFECPTKGPVKKITITGTDDKDVAPFSLGRVVDSVVASTKQDRFSGVEGAIKFEDSTLKWALACGFNFPASTCRVFPVDRGPNHLQCSYSPEGEGFVLFQQVQQTMSTYKKRFIVDEFRSGHWNRTYTDPDHRVRVSVSPSELVVEAVPAPY